MRYIVPRIFPSAQAAHPAVLLVLLLGLLAGGCATREPPAPTPAQLPPQALDLAHQLQAAGDNVGAAREYERLAQSAASPLREQLLLDAADAQLRGGQLKQAQRLLEHLELTGAASDLDTRKRALSADLALSSGEPERALELIPATPTGVSPSLQVRMHEIRARAYLAVGNALESARERVILEPLLRSPEAVSENHRAIWQALGGMTDQALAELQRGVPPDVFTGWMELVRISRIAPRDPGRYETLLQGWRERYAGHPATADLGGAAQLPTAAVGMPAQLALLLPFSGEFSSQAATLRDGFLTAYYSVRRSGPVPALRIYDTARASGIREVYERAVADGAGLVVGPLSKKAVAELASSGPLSVPVLALNYLDATAAAPPAQFYQFGLLPEDEARQAAERASLDGRSRAVALIPDGEWGMRLLESFRRRFGELGGTLLGYESYSPTESDFSTPIQRLLRVDFAAKTRRTDVDMLFIVAYPRQARLIRPQLLFQYAGDLPVYTTSHAYAGHADPAVDGDLDGVMFCDIPWLLPAQGDPPIDRQLLQRLWPQSSGNEARLYALGMDAFTVLPYLGSLGDASSTGVPGWTGSVSADAERRLHRQLRWARFENGTPRLIETAAPVQGGETAPSNPADLLSAPPLR